MYPFILTFSSGSALVMCGPYPAKLNRLLTGSAILELEKGEVNEQEWYPNLWGYHPVTTTTARGCLDLSAVF